MADAVATQIIENGSRNLIMSFTNNSDGTGEANVTKVTAAQLQNLAATPSAKVRRIWYNITSGSVIIAWKATTNSIIAVLSGYGYIDLKDTMGFWNPAASGVTGDITFTTKTFTAPSGYTIVLEMVKGNTA